MEKYHCRNMKFIAKDIHCHYSSKFCWFVTFVGFVCTCYLSLTAHTKRGGLIGIIKWVFSPAHVPRTAIPRLYPCPFSVSSLRFEPEWAAMDCLKWSTNWIVIFSHGGIQVREKKASCSGLVWLLFFSFSILFFAQWDFFSTRLAGA